MALNIITGKPGSGKSYYSVRLIVYKLKEFRDFEAREGKPIESKIYTNIKLDYDAINDYLGVPGISERYLVYLDERFFQDDLGRLVIWWEKFAPNTFVFLDEVQYYINIHGQKTVDEYMKKFDLWISTHRHDGQELFFITQHTDNIARSTLAMAEIMRRVDNIKNKVVPILGIPLSDFGTVKKAFGFDHQYAIVDFGKYIGKSWRVEFSERVLLEPSIFACYKSLADTATGDNVDMKLSPPAALLWFIKKHWFHLTLKAAFAYFFIRAIIAVVLALPSALSAAVMPDKKEPIKKELNTEKETNKIDKPLRENKPIEKKESAPASVEPDKIVIIGDNYIYKNDGRRVNIGEEFIYNGKKCRLSGVDVVSSSVSVVPVAEPSSGSDCNEQGN